MAVEVYRVEYVTVMGKRVIKIQPLGVVEEAEAEWLCVREGKGHYHVCGAAGNLYELFVAIDGSVTTTDRHAVN
jgi:hypothetical protein